MSATMSATVRKYAAKPISSIIGARGAGVRGPLRRLHVRGPRRPRQHRSASTDDGAPPLRRREVREVDPLQPQVERAPLGDLAAWRRRAPGARRTARASRRRLQPALGVRAADVVRAIGTISRMHSSASARNASSGTRYRTGFVATAPRSSRSANRSIARTSSCDPAPSDARPPRRTGRSERLAEAAASVARRRRAAGDGQPPGCDRGPSRRQPGRVRADLLGRDRRVAALAQHVRVGDEPAEVRVARCHPERAARRWRIAGGGARRADGDRSAEDRPNPL